MKKILLPLKFTVPGILLIFGSILGVYSFQRDVYLSNLRTEEKGIREARFAASQTSGILEYLFRRNDLEGAKLVISQIGANPNLNLAFLVNENDKIVLTTRYEMQNRLLNEATFSKYLPMLAKVRKTLSAKVILSEDRQSILAMYPVLLGSVPGELRSSRVGVLSLDYNLAILKQGSFADALRRSLEAVSVLAILCTAVWYFFNRTLTKRVLQLVKASDRLAEGDLNIRTGLEGRDELAQISAAFDQMASRIQQDTKALQKSQASLAYAQQIARLGSWELEIARDQVSGSEEIYRIFCLEKKQRHFAKQEWLNFIHPDDRSMVKDAVEMAIAQGEFLSIDYRIMAADGTTKTLHCTAEVICNQTQQPIYLRGTVQDVTERVSQVRQLQDLVDREALFNRLASQIRNTLDLDTILETAVVEIQHFLQIDRCQFIWCQNGEFPLWNVVKEAKATDLPTLIGVYAIEPNSPILEKILKGDIIRTNDINQWNDLEIIKALGVGNHYALLALPIQVPGNDVGVISFSQGRCVRTWSDREVSFLQAIADQIAIAISQAELYTQAQKAAAIAQEQAQAAALALQQLQDTQTQLIQTEKMSSLGQLVAGVAHEINNPVSFIYGNLTPATDYIQDLLQLLKLYQQHYPQPATDIEACAEAIELEFLIEDLPKLLASMKMGADRIRQIVLSLRNFSRLDEAEMKPVNLHEGIDSTLLILQSRLKSVEIKVIKNYENLPLIECYAGQLNQVFMNLLSNAIDALETEVLNFNKFQLNSAKKHTNLSAEPLESLQPAIWIDTKILDSERILIEIADNGPGMTEAIKNRIFDPFFTTKPIGKGTGLGLSISYQIIVEKHQGLFQCFSKPGQGTRFLITLPIRQSDPIVPARDFVSNPSQFLV